MRAGAVLQLQTELQKYQNLLTVMNKEPDAQLSYGTEEQAARYHRRRQIR